MIKKKYTALRQYRNKRTEGRKRKLRQLTQKTKDLIKQKRQQYIEKVQDSTTRLLKEFSREISSSLCSLFNMSLATAAFLWNGNVRTLFPCTRKIMLNP